MEPTISNSHKRIYQVICLAVAVITVSIFLSIFWKRQEQTPQASPTLLPTLAVIDLPKPEIVCDTPVTWRGLQPGVSTRQDVIKILGKPQKEDFGSDGKNSFFFYTYELEKIGVVANHATDRIFFRADGVVDWIAAIVGDRDGSYHTVDEMIPQIGTVLDTAYANSNYSPYTTPGKIKYDVRGGPDQLYVWSKCGLVLDILALKSDKFTLTVLNPDIYYKEKNRSPTTKSIILMKFLFIPTSYKGFTDYYKYKIPYSFAVSETWDGYMRTVREMNNK